MNRPTGSPYLGLLVLTALLLATPAEALPIRDEPQDPEPDALTDEARPADPIESWRTPRHRRSPPVITTLFESTADVPLDDRVLDAQRAIIGYRFALIRIRGPAAGPVGGPRNPRAGALDYVPTPADVHWQELRSTVPKRPAPGRRFQGHPRRRRYPGVQTLFQQPAFAEAASATVMTVSGSRIAVAPEPGTALLLGAGLVALAARTGGRRSG